MFEDIQKHRQAVAENIEKSFQIGFTESEDLQKAHNVGDVHPNGKWVWTQLPSGKYDWRVIKKTAQANAAPQSNSQKAIPKKNGIELTSKGIKEYINKNSATRDERMKAMAEVYKALKDSGKNKKVDTFVKEMSSGSPSVDMTTRKYVEAINDGATHDEAVAFADKCYKEFTTNLNKFQEKVYGEGVSPSTAAKMFASATEWFKAQKFEKKAVSESSVKKDKAKLPSKLGNLEFNEDKPTGEHWYEGEMDGQRVRILQETVGKDDWWVAEISGRNVVDDNNKTMTFDNVQDAFEEVKQEIKSSELPKVNFSEKDFRREVHEELMEKYPNAKVKLHHYLAPRTDYYDNNGNLMRSTPSITEFYSDGSQSRIGGYEIYFDRADSIGTFRTKESAVAALNKYVNAMRVKGHPKPKWIYNASKGDYQMNYKL